MRILLTKEEVADILMQHYQNRSYSFGTPLNVCVTPNGREYLAEITTKPIDMGEDVAKKQVIPTQFASQGYPLNGAIKGSGQFSNPNFEASGVLGKPADSEGGEN